MRALEQIDKAFGEQKVLDGLSLDLAENGINCLLGVSGSGKSTLLRIASGLEKQDGGRVLVPASECGVVFQDSRLLPWLTTAQNLSLAIAPEKRAEAEPLLKKALSDVALDADKAGSLLPRELSGGMAQRVGIARALLRKPRYLMMDEPFVSLDAMTRKELELLLLRLVPEQAMTCLFVTHDMDEAFEIADRIHVLRKGKIDLSLERENFADWRQRKEVRERIIKLLNIHRG